MDLCGPTENPALALSQNFRAHNLLQFFYRKNIYIVTCPLKARTVEPEETTVVNNFPRQPNHVIAAMDTHATINNRGNVGSVVFYLVHA
jgi:hypothetical protein